MKSHNLVGLFAIALGVTISIDGMGSASGAVVGGTDIGAASARMLIGAAFFILGTLAVAIRPAEEAGGYYKERVDELTKRGLLGDIWVARWELPGIVDELKARGFALEHGKDTLAMHIGHEGPSRQHMLVYGERKDTGGDYIVDRHLFVADDPRDDQLQYVGYTKKSGALARVRGKTYHPSRHFSSKRTLEHITVD